MSLLNLFLGFRGRIGRGMWWLCHAVAILMFVGAQVVFKMVTGLDVGAEAGEENIEAAVASIGAKGVYLALALMVVLMLLALWISIAGTVKRFHDRDKSGFWWLINFVPFGGFWILAECGFFEGMYESNGYGDPGSGVFSESASSRFAGEAVIRSRQVGYAVANSSRAPGMGYGMRDEAPVARGARMAQPATGFGRRNTFR